ncbi:MAG TPA: RNA polymerase sigma factor [Gemmatimonadaceae bacterium]|nr:RNA polymerase sigma factor [Gemmatimonadaceae bacterium]
MTDPGDERSLVSRLAEHGDSRAFGALYERHTTYLYRLALRLTGGDAELAGDLVHDAWVRAVSRLATFEWKASLRTWLAGFVVNVARERRRATRESIALESELAADDGPLDGTFDRVDLERALAALAPRYREVLILHDVEGYTHDDIAGLLGIDAGTSRSQLSRARAAMRRALAGTNHRNAGR